MQKQAAPPRFRGLYPHQLKIPSNLLPEYYPLKSAIKQLQKSSIIRQDGDLLIGYFPKLVMQITDEEISTLAGTDYENFDNIDCQDIRCTCYDKPRFLQLFASTEADRDAIVYNNCKRTIFAAAKRQIKSAPVPSLEVATDFSKFARQKIEELVGDDLRSFGYSFNQWYNHLPLAKQKRMDVIRDMLFSTDGDECYNDWNQIPDQYYHYEAICKVEIQGLDGKPRMVCAIPDLVKYVMGPVCWKLEELFSEKIPTYCGGQNLTQMQDKINHYIDEGFCIVAEGDGSAFDNTQDVLLKDIDRYIYEIIAPQVHHVPEGLFRKVALAFYKIMDVITIIEKKRTTIMSYAVLGTVFSGDCDTTLMNTLRMGFYNWYTNDRIGFKINRQFVCFSKGDDFTVMYNRMVKVSAVKQGYYTYWLQKPDSKGPSFDGCDERIYGLGQILKFIEFGLPNSIKFCSLRAWYTDPNSLHIYLTRDPAKFTTLSKYSRKALPLGDTALAAYCMDQAYALKVCYNGIHYFDDMAQLYLKASKRYANGQTKNVKYGSGKDRRITLDLEPSDLNNGYSYVPRKKFIKIVGNYWETMQQIEKLQTCKLTPSQLEYVNFQIDAEFNDRQLYVLGAEGL